MATNPKGLASESRSANGVNEAAILRILAPGNVVSDAELQTAMSKQLSPRWLPPILRDMNARGLIARVSSPVGTIWRITEAGRAKLPRQLETRWDNWRPLQKQRVVRREGSDRALMLPSMAAGQLRPWRHPV